MRPETLLIIEGSLPDQLSAPLVLLPVMLIRGLFRAGFPIGVSYPHFYQADPALVEAVDGSYPDKEKHESHFYVEPVSSTTLLLYTALSTKTEMMMDAKKLLKIFTRCTLLPFTSL
jgi:hypothetical protein